MAMNDRLSTDDEHQRVKNVCGALIKALSEYIAESGEQDTNIVINGVMLFMAENALCVAAESAQDMVAVFMTMVPTIIKNIIACHNALMLEEKPTPTDKRDLQ